ncbi:hypothetical protein CDV55_102347 [Aspergillus turcosus]|uniref:Alpha/beta hydrolase fold-3 domain-containing protein n=1 Tax=Aspergillus turcosus TaxID=1245748 RepID=A0A397GWW5_9EURO|nr:hypothetical protein CDV55_102347 [Aspergillus turcosus]RLL95722.1 hypothetical protein CFD26_104723 [Aspergillus turcosus]
MCPFTRHPSTPHPEIEGSHALAPPNSTLLSSEAFRHNTLYRGFIEPLSGFTITEITGHKAGKWLLMLGKLFIRLNSHSLRVLISLGSSFQSVTDALVPIASDNRLSTTAASYKRFAKSKGIIPRTSSWGERGQGCWVGSPDALSILVWFHGGNYYSPAHPAYFHFLHGVVDAVCQTGKQFAVFVPSYTLAPHAQYPSQLQEGLETLRYLIEIEGKSASNIVLGGDSAGGNLVLAILSHLSHPHPDIAGDLTLKTNLGGAVMICPWVTFDQTWTSVERNKKKDSVALIPSSISAKHFLGDKPPDNYNEPLRAPLEWWFEVKACQLLLISGDDDIMVDSHRAFATNLSMANPHNTQIIFAADEGHVAPVLDLMLGDRSEFESTKAMKKWLLWLI